MVQELRARVAQASQGPSLPNANNQFWRGDRAQPAAARPALLAEAFLALGHHGGAIDLPTLGPRAREPGRSRGARGGASASRARSLTYVGGGEGLRLLATLAVI